MVKSDCRWRMLDTYSLYIYTPSQLDWGKIGPTSWSKKSSKHSRGVAKIKKLLPMLRMKHVFFLLPMLRKNAVFHFFAPLCGINGEKKVVVSLRRCCKTRKYASHAPYETFFFVLPMLRKNAIFEIDLTPTVKMTFFRGG